MGAFDSAFAAHRADLGDEVACGPDCVDELESWGGVCSYGRSWLPRRDPGRQSGPLFWWALAMLPFMYVLYTLLLGLKESTKKQPESARGLIVAARYLTAVSWLTYPGVYMIKMVGLAGPDATA